jgi:hypothetical protein
MSSSIFDLKTNVNELSSANQGTSRLTYDQIVPTRDVTSGNFPNGSIYIKWNVSGEKWWIPSRSYLRMRCQLTKGDGNPFVVADKIAPSMNLMANLFQNMELRINDKTVSRVPNYVSQIEALENRLNKSQAQLNGIMSSTNFMQADFSDRQAQICSDGNALAPNATVKDSVAIIGLTDGTNALIATNTFAYDEGSGVVTFAVGATPGAVLPDIRKIFQGGDQIRINGGGRFLTVVSTTTASTMLCLAGVGAAIVTAVLNDATVSATRLRNGSDERNIQDFELCWTPCLSLFKLQHAMPAGTYTLVLNPFPASVYQLQAIESRNFTTDFTSSVSNPADKTPADNLKVRFNVVDMYFYCNTVDGPRADNLSYLLDLNQTTCQQESIKSASFAQRNYDISPSTYALSVAFQDGRCNNDPRVPSSIFKCYDVAYTPDKELSLERMYISYSGQQRPSPDADPSFSVGVDRTVQRYVDTMIENGSYFDSGGAESIQEFHKRGSYYYFSWARDGTDRSTRCSVFSGFSKLLGNAQENANCLLFTHSKQVGKITVQDGLVIDVQVEEA